MYDNSELDYSVPDSRSLPESTESEDQENYYSEAGGTDSNITINLEDDDFGRY